MRDMWKKKKEENKRKRKFNSDMAEKDSIWLDLQTTVC